MSRQWDIGDWPKTRWIAAICGFLPTVLGMVVLLGWYTHNQVLIQVSPTFVPMQYNTALGFLVCGAGLLFAVRASTRAALALGVLAAMIGVFTLIEYIFGVDLGIDQLLMEHYVTVATSNPGRMAPNTALCFSLAGFAILLSVNSETSQRSVVAISVLGSLTFGLGVIAFAGYAMGLETAYGWGHLTRMAVHTSAGFIVLGIGLVAYAWHQTNTTIERLPSWFSMVVGVIVLTFTLSLWQALNAVEAIGIAQYFVITFGVILALALSVAVNLSAVSHRRAFELEEAHRNLEGQVEERTKELTKEIAEREHAEKALRESEERFGNFFKLPQIGAAIYRAKDKSWIAISGGLCALLRYSEDELWGLAWADVTHPDDLEENLRLFDEAISDEGDDTYSMEKRFIRKDGVIIDGEIHVQCIRDASGQPDYNLVTVIDITERKQTEEKLRVARDVAEQATKAKGSFLASMSHEIRTPMNGVVGMADLLSQTKLNEDQRSMLNTIRESGDALLTIINDILDFSKIEAGKLDIENVTVSVGDVLEGAAAIISPTASRKNIHIVTYVDPDIPESLLGDPVRLRQIIFNLTGNAVKFSEEGEVIVRADKMREDGGSVRIKISVIDNGIGVSKEAQSKLFEAFSQADGSTTRNFGGTGLGLTICKGLADTMGGDITVESQLGSGSTFAVELSLARGDEKESKSDDADLDGVRLLMITDSDIFGFAVKRYLENWGANVEIASNEEDAEEKISALKGENNIFNVIAFDFNLGEDRQLKIVEEYKSDDTRFLIMLDGQRRSARIQSPDIITLDGNPLRQSRLINAVAVAVGRASPVVKSEFEEQDIEAAVALSIENALAQGTLILLAEDNITNQNVIQRQLKLLGYTCEIKNDGKLALEAWRKRDYGLLLTDCHMPNMDGFELTAAIRSDEEGSSHRAPIIAVTANALDGEAQRCIAGGMDDYLSKPLAMNDLKAMLKKWMPDATPVLSVNKISEAIELAAVQAVDAEAAEGSSNAANSTGAIDPSVLKAVFGDNEETFREILQEFVEPSADNAREIEVAFENHSAAGIAAASHKLKSSSRSVGANELADICTELEAAGRNDDWDKINDLAPRLPNVIKEIGDYIEKL